MSDRSIFNGSSLAVDQIVTSIETADTINVNTGNIAVLNTTTGNIASVLATTGTIATLGSTTGNITTLNSTVGHIGTVFTSTLNNGAPLTLPTSADTLVGKNTTDILANKTLTTPVISQISNTGLLTLPTSTDTLIGRSTTDTLTNKTITTPVMSQILAGTATFQIPQDAVGADTFVLGGYTQTLTNKTLTLPKISQISNTGTLTLPTSTDTLIGRDTTDTLTNKTLTSPMIAGTGTIGCAGIVTSTGITLPAEAGAAQAVFSIYEENNTTMTGTFSGLGYTSASLTITVVKIGKVVFLRFPGFVGTANTASALVFNVNLPTRWRPPSVAIRSLTIGVRDNSVDKIGILDISTGGTLTIYAGSYGTNFSGAGTSGIRDSCVSFSIL